MCCKVCEIRRGEPPLSETRAELSGNEEWPVGHVCPGITAGFVKAGVLLLCSVPFSSSSSTSSHSPGLGPLVAQGVKSLDQGRAEVA